MLVYNKDIFLAGIRSFIGVNHKICFIQGMPIKKSLIDFIYIYERAIKRQKLNETKEPYENEYKRLKLVNPFHIEIMMAKVYTRNIFYVFQDELQYSLVCYSLYK